jgi:hypothetical protein
MVLFGRQAMGAKCFYEYFKGDVGQQRQGCLLEVGTKCLANPVGGESAMVGVAK